MKTRTLVADFLARTAIIALVAVTAAFFAGCGEKDADDDDDDDRKTEKKIADEDDDDEDDDGGKPERKSVSRDDDDEEESKSESRTATSRKKVSSDKKKKTDMTEDEAEAIVSSGKKSKKDLFGGGKTKKTAGKKKDASTPGADLQKGMDAYKEKNYDDAVKSFKKAADAGDTDAKLLLAGCYGNGNGIEKDEEKALALIREAAADDGNIKAKFMVVALDIAQGDIDEEEAFGKLLKMDTGLRKLAEADDPIAIFLYVQLCSLKAMTAESSDERKEANEDLRKWTKKLEESGADKLFED